jgi:hypothetical protein
MNFEKNTLKVNTRAITDSLQIQSSPLINPWKRRRAKARRRPLKIRLLSKRRTA